MTKRKPNYCPYCGTALGDRTFENRERAFCPACDEFVFQNPVPVGCVVVLDGGEVLFVKRGHAPDRGKWATPAGILEVDEPAAVGAARELREETGVRVDPDDLVLVRTGFEMADPDDGSILSICFAVERAATTGEPTVGDEPLDVRFEDPTELLAGDERTRSVDLRRIEAAFERLRDGDSDLYHSGIE